MEDAIPVELWVLPTVLHLLGLPVHALVNAHIIQHFSLQLQPSQLGEKRSIRDYLPMLW